LARRPILPQACAQLASQQLARWRTGQLLNEAKSVRRLDAAQPRLAQRWQVASEYLRIMTGVDDDERCGLAEHLVHGTDHAHVGDAGDFQQRRLDLLG
jgi:hypothetical protein